jgi:hypothetical protein
VCARESERSETSEGRSITTCRRGCGWGGGGAAADELPPSACLLDACFASGGSSGHPLLAPRAATFAPAPARASAAERGSTPETPFAETASAETQLRPPPPPPSERDPPPSSPPPAPAAAPPPVPELSPPPVTPPPWTAGGMSAASLPSDLRSDDDDPLAEALAAAAAVVLEEAVVLGREWVWAWWLSRMLRACLLSVFSRFSLAIRCVNCVFFFASCTHTSPYVSIRQHSSAWVSMGEHG